MVATTAPMATTAATETSSCTSTPETTDSTAAASTSTTVPSTSTTAESTTTSRVTTTIDRELAAQQQRLADLGYWLGPVDGLFGPSTAHAITAFQKAQGLPRTGDLDAETLDRLATASRPTARSSTGAVLEVDLSRQILLVVSGGGVDRVYDIATGTSATPTPPGEFTIYHEIDGYRHAPLGTLYRPKYFNGGIALHGYTSVPTQPASHGCVRLTYPAMDHLWASGVATIGATVLVY